MLLLIGLSNVKQNGG